ncbi:MAG: hypothetical protein GTN38_02540, partial [Candidatus Aenigmarchaeota archaeon]|nr:hypothetical protein [Candidatus Aenigmarchaeota archaeon]NIQ18359.1 hypothetical protein [Candidatus Aenigmarchaeota archaeon]
MGREKVKMAGISIISVALFALFFFPFAIADEVPAEEVPVCIDISPITTFHDGDSSETLVILGGSSDTSTK